MTKGVVMHTRSISVLGLAAAGMALLVLPARAQLGYTFDITTHYQFGDVPGALTPFGSAGPDTGEFTIANDGTTTFTGTIGDVAVSNFAGDNSFTSAALTLNPGDSITVEVNSESSNSGGFNGPFNTVPQPGVMVKINGLINGTEAVNLSVNDADLHSGVPRMNP